ncbi:bifunctional DNA-formamidopyrimidine glycosylase/DNA-(apurinic or apyrimidinic site) lyase [Thermosyntropha sp.]|uniref:bifunctional DNA-formamidopyrimidine glycosylase/DNA-(apurinic or apyrimidinic site) lyase n=1 Tax=Thermosyntropha sp. TaxID=2740820 RepID=UPI0025CCEBCD|nr:bifunctional DNA-formamidopyrimidine glycosylase/DNA-(apurinic or apyrimidinic site) lyase [Thermosyntropha sp.]MBO8158885.1 bifunctional DNA-formamidopyrimidine glycosylase/DNA-(apurinic or apyrimidinic site) lyase [Thermosyntropha sp.]
MPELPELETIKNSLKSLITGAEIKHIEIKREDVVRLNHYNPEEALERKIVEVGRRGKFLILKLEDNYNIILHLGMSGRFFIVEEGVGLDEPHIHGTFYLDNGKKLIFKDPRRFGGIWFAKDLDNFFVRMGKEPLTEEFTPEYLKKIFKNRKTAVKNLLLDQSLIAGIGNIYADEALFAAGIRPDRKAYSFKDRELEVLCEAVKEVLKRGIEERGTTFRDYRDGYGREGNFQNFLNVYGREGMPCRRCGTGIVRKKIGGRSSFFCPNCQD